MNAQRLIRDHAHRTGYDGMAAAADLYLTARDALSAFTEALQEQWRQIWPGIKYAYQLVKDAHDDDPDAWHADLWLTHTRRYATKATPLHAYLGERTCPICAPQSQPNV